MVSAFLLPFTFLLLPSTMLRMARKESKSVKKEKPAADAQSSESSGLEQSQKGPRKTIWREYFEFGIHTALMFVFFITFIGRTVGVPTGSMQNTIYIGDYFLINKFIFAPGSHPFFLPKREIRRGDIIVFKYPGDRDNPDRDKMSGVTPYSDYFIKRVIGLPGEIIEIRGATVLINNQPLPEYRVPAEPGINGKAPLTTLASPPRQSNEPYTVYYSPRTLSASQEKPPDIFHYAVEKPYVIPPGNYFVMGDNRDDSADSRAWGPVAAELVIGRALFVFWSKDESKPSHNLLLDFFLRARWGRTGTMIK
jgi:signal peptidase I